MARVFDLGINDGIAGVRFPSIGSSPANDHVTGRRIIGEEAVVARPSPKDIEAAFELPKNVVTAPTAHSVVTG
jgi:hypothetical protein